MILKNDRTPVAVVDIGSNSVRLIVYEDAGRAPAPVFNEKVLCGLGRSLATTGKLAPDAVKRALRALRRFRALIDQLGVPHVEVIATAAAREAENGPDFIAQAERILGRRGHRAVRHAGGRARRARRGLGHPRGRRLCRRSRRRQP